MSSGQPYAAAVAQSSAAWALASRVGRSSEVGEHAAFQGCRGVLGQDAVRVAGDDFGFDACRIERVEPVAPLIVQAFEC